MWVLIVLPHSLFVSVQQFVSSLTLCAYSLAVSVPAVINSLCTYSRQSWAIIACLRAHSRQGCFLLLLLLSLTLCVRIACESCAVINYLHAFSRQGCVSSLTLCVCIACESCAVINYLHAFSRQGCVLSLTLCVHIVGIAVYAVINYLYVLSRHGCFVINSSCTFSRQSCAVINSLQNTTDRVVFCHEEFQLMLPTT